MNPVLLIIVILLIFGAGGYGLGWHGGFPGAPYSWGGGIISLIILLLVLRLFGII